MVILSGLKDLDGEFEAIYFKSVTDALRGLRKTRVKTASGNYGAIHIWLDDYGLYRGERMKDMLPRSKTVAKNQNQLKAWLRQELPKIYKPSTNYHI